MIKSLTKTARLIKYTQSNISSHHNAWS